MASGRPCKYPEHEFLSDEERLKSNTRRYRTCHRDRILENKRRQQREYTLKTRFKMSLEEYERILKTQNYSCAICKFKPEGEDRYRRGKNLAVDHNHITNKNRGLLCDKCNRGLGHFNDNEELLQNAIDYLKRYL